MKIKITATLLLCTIFLGSATAGSGAHINCAGAIGSNCTCTEKYKNQIGKCQYSQGYEVYRCFIEINNNSIDCGIGKTVTQADRVKSSNDSAKR